MELGDSSRCWSAGAYILIAMGLAGVGDSVAARANVIWLGEFCVGVGR